MDDLDLGATIKGFSPGQKAFNRYSLKKILGRGGMGVVWLAEDEELEREVALKFLPEVVAMDKQSVFELKRETRRSLELTHPHIVRIYDFVQDGRAAAISMEYVAGDSLAALKMDQPNHCYGSGQLAKWVKQLCEALDYAHQKAEVVHRDLKPANLMIDARGDLKIADFGIAASVSDSVSRVSAQGGSSGTPVYMSPQQMMGEKPAVTDDIYSLGATLYDLLTSKPPFHSGNVLLQVQSKQPQSIAERRKELAIPGASIPPDWEAVIAACLAKTADERPQTVAEVARRLGLDDGRFTRRETRASKPPAAARPLDLDVGETVKFTPPEKNPPAQIVQTEATGSKLFRNLGLAAAVLLLAGMGYYFGVHAPEQARIATEQARAAEENRQAAQRKEEELKRKADLAEQQRIAGEKTKAEAAEKARREQEQLAAAEKQKAEVLENARVRLLADAQQRIREFRRDGDPAGSAELEKDINASASQLDEARRTVLLTEWGVAAREAAELLGRIGLGVANTQGQWRSLSQMAEMARTGKMSPDALQARFLGTAETVRQSFIYSDSVTGRKFPVAQRGFYLSSVAQGTAETALLVAWGGAGVRFGLDGGTAQNVAGLWDNLSPGPHRLSIEREGFETVVRELALGRGEITNLGDVIAGVAFKPVVKAPTEAELAAGVVQKFSGGEWSGKFSVVDPFGVVVVSTSEVVLTSYGLIKSLQLKLPATVTSIDPATNTIVARFNKRWLGMWAEGEVLTLRWRSPNLVEMETKVNRKEKKYTLTR